jgi:Fe-S cluster assembly ATPase SufC
MSVSNNNISLDDELIRGEREMYGVFIGGEKKRNNIIGLLRSRIKKRNIDSFDSVDMKNGLYDLKTTKRLFNKNNVSKIKDELG